MTDAHTALRLALGDIEPNDTNYPVRYVRVFQAAAMALQCGYTAGVRLDPAEPDWPVVYIDLPTGQVSWHMPAYSPAWDRHTTAEKYERIRAFIAQEAP
ncbi:hypothetical protein [Amycolatopsis kentuckyensis]|uniref:hypothetical protein n=1 Tax=Amycolatopsis kentuckyensis TaxID=218823 RepID=UPI000A3BE323|nr:hypothetical protein [Amycolatopsis kentuckyensis]